MSPFKAKVCVSSGNCPTHGPLCLILSLVINAFMLLVQARTRNELYLITVLVTPVFLAVEFEISSPGTTSRSGLLLRNAAECDIRFSILPGEIVQAVQCSSRNVLGLAQSTYSTVNQIV